MATLPNATLVAHKYFEVVQGSRMDHGIVGSSVAIPIFKEAVIEGLIEESLKFYERKGSWVNLEGALMVVGDLNGNLHNLIQIFNDFGLPPKIRYVFLGNYIDYGEFSLEVATMLMALNLLYPDSVYLLKGLNESVSSYLFRGLQADIEAVYFRKSLYDKFLNAFSNFPSAALINNTYLCCQPRLIINKQDYRIKQTTVHKIDSIDKFEQYYDQMEAKLDEDTSIYVEYAQQYDVECIILSECPEESCLTSYAAAISMSSCNYESKGCVLSIDRRNELEPYIFDTCGEKNRATSRFHVVKDDKYSNLSKKKKISQASSKIALNTIAPIQSCSIPLTNQRSCTSVLTFFDNDDT